MLTSPRRQRGMTAIGMMLVIAMIAIFVFFGLKVYPIYYDSFKVGSALRSLKAESDLVNKPTSEVVERLLRRLRVDNMDAVDKGDISVTKAGGVMTVAVDWEVQEPLVGNIDIVVHFEKEIEVGN